MTRLETICSLIEPCGTLADIGCDHGIVSLYAAKNSLAQKIYACDVSAECLGKARSILSRYPQVDFLCGDGFSPLAAAGIAPDAAVICGMGGELIIKIMQARHCNPDVIAGGQKNTDKLRIFFCDNGYRIDKDEKVFERGKFYDVIRARYDGERHDVCEAQALFGMFYREKNEVRRRYFEAMIEKTRSYKQTETNRELLLKLTEAYKWQL